MIILFLARWHQGQVWREGCGWQHGAAYGFTSTGTLNAVFGIKVIKVMILTVLAQWSRGKVWGEGCG